MPDVTANVRLAEYRPYWAARADPGPDGRTWRSPPRYEIAIGLERDPAVRRFLQRRQSALPA